MLHPRRLLFAVIAGAAVSGVLVGCSALVAYLHATTSSAGQAGEAEVAGVFVLAALGLTMSAATLIGYARWRHGETPTGRSTVRHGMGVLAVAGMLLTAGLAWVVGWPYAAAAPIALVPVAVMARDATRP